MMYALASAAICLATGLIVVMDWVPTPLNRNIGTVSVRERLPSTLIHGTIGAVLATLCALHIWLSALIAGTWYALVFSIAFSNWWVPYFAGSYPGEVTPEVYARDYSGNMQVLRPFRANPVVPDLQHILIHAAVAGASLASFAAAIL
jgi:hypothetical protein